MSSVSTLRRAAVPVAAVAALAAGGVVFAASASAATAPTVAITAPAQIINDGSLSEPATITINNGASGSATLVNTRIQIDITGPAGLNCADISLTGAHNFTFTGTGGHCVAQFDGYGQGTGSTPQVFNELVNLDQPGLTGTASTVVSLIQLSGSDPVATLATSNTANTTITNGVAPSFNAAPPAATIYKNYSYQFAKTTAFPAADSDAGSAYAFLTHKNSNGTYSWTTRSPHLATIAGNDDWVISLNSPFVFDVTTGKIVNTEPLTETDSVRYWTITIIENNGRGGASSATVGVGGGTTAVPTPSLSVNDVVSPSFTLPILFSDVAVNAPLATEIYDLADNGDISGFADGSFRPGNSVTREEFVAILARALNISSSEGPCSTIHPSAFADVKNSSIFCEFIRDLSSEHIIGGFADGLFHPTAKITRGQIAAILYRAFAIELTENPFNGDAPCPASGSSFNDVSSTNVFCGDIEWLSDNGIANGFADGGFHPNANATRAQTAAFIDRFLNTFNV